MEYRGGNNVNRETFLQQLRMALNGLPQEEIENAVAYYTEYLEDAGEENEQQAIADLGTAASVAAQIRANAALRALKKQPPTAKKGIHAVWLVVLAVFASPIALPIAIAAVAVAFALVITVLAVLFALGVATVAMLAAGIAALVASFVVLFSNIGAGLFGIGGAMVCTGLALLLGVLSIQCARWGFQGIAHLLAKLTRNRKENKSNE